MTPILFSNSDYNVGLQVLLCQAMMHDINVYERVEIDHLGIYSCHVRTYDHL